MLLGRGRKGQGFHLRVQQYRNPVICHYIGLMQTQMKPYKSLLSIIRKAQAMRWQNAAKLLSLVAGGSVALVMILVCLTKPDSEDCSCLSIEGPGMHCGGLKNYQHYGPIFLVQL